MQPRISDPAAPPQAPTASAVPPRWARSLDVLCLVLVIVAVVIAESGGFRMRVGGIRIALTSAYRLLAIAIALAVVRHFLAPRSADLP